MLEDEIRRVAQLDSGMLPYRYDDLEAAVEVALDRYATKLAKQIWEERYD